MKQTWRALARVLKASDCMHTEGDQVSFDVERGPKGPKAVNVTVASLIDLRIKKEHFFKLKAAHKIWYAAFLIIWIGFFDRR